MPEVEDDAALHSIPTTPEGVSTTMSTSGPLG
jgi:hypothetical protein